MIEKKNKENKAITEHLGKQTLNTEKFSLIQVQV